MSGLQYLLQQNDLSHGIVKHRDSEHATLRTPFLPPRITLVTTADLVSQSCFGTTAYTPEGTTQSSKTLEEANTHPDIDTNEYSKRSENECHNRLRGDNRTFFVPEKYPWHCVGKVRTPGGWRTGTMIGTRHVLTTAHGLFYQPEEKDDRSNCGWVSYTPACYNGRGSMHETRVVEVIMWSGKDKHLMMGTDDDRTRSAAFDYAVLILADRVGDTLGWVGTGAYGADVHDRLPFQYIGYAMEMAMGEQPTVTSGGHLGIIEEEKDKDEDGGCIEGYMMADLGGYTPGLAGGAVWYFPQATCGPCIVGVGGWTKGEGAQRAETARDFEYYGGGPALAKIVRWATSHRA
jgi:hypothetical protein